MAAFEESCTTPATVAALNCAKARKPIQNKSRRRNLTPEMRGEGTIAL
jgi:hypothetical protein